MRLVIIDASMNMIGSYSFSLLLLILQNFELSFISASRDTKVTDDPDWNQYVRWRWHFLGKISRVTDPQILPQFQTWVANLKEMNEHNARFERGAETYLKDVNKFSLQAPHKLVSLLLPAVSLAYYYEGDPCTSTFFRIPQTYRKRVQLDDRHVPWNVDWPLLRHGMQDMKNGIPLFFNPSGWAVSAIKAVEAQFEKMTGDKISLSGKEVIACATVPSNRPPITLDAFDYILQNGVSLYSTYQKKPAEMMNCNRSQDDPVHYIKAYKLLAPDNQNNLKIAVALIGPISVSVKVTENFFFYKSGVFYDTLCQDDDEKPNHAVLLVGYGVDPSLGEYWKIQNSWGSAWGEKGYARMARNTIISCGIASAAFYPEL